MEIKVAVVTHNGYYLIIPEESRAGDHVDPYVNAGLKQNPQVRRILWNDVVKHFTVKTTAVFDRLVG